MVKMGQNVLLKCSDHKMDACNRFTVSKNPNLVYHHGYICWKLDFHIFAHIFPRSKMGVAILKFPQWFEFYNFFWCYWEPSRDVSNHQTLFNNFFSGKCYSYYTIRNVLVWSGNIFHGRHDADFYSIVPVAVI